MNNNKNFQPFLSNVEGTPCYVAGLPGYNRNFTRDTMISGILASSQELLESQIQMSHLHQGKKYDSNSGEEPGKIHHEYPGVSLRSPYLTTYDACDTTSLYIIGLEILQKINHKSVSELEEKYRESIESAVAYISHHLKDHIFMEFPPKDAKHFSLRATYWKDSILSNTRGIDEPTFPVAYGLVQFQTARALLAAGRLLNHDKYLETAKQMFIKGIETFITKDSYCLCFDETERIEHSSSDELHALAYIPKEYASYLPFESIKQRAISITTPEGIACTPKEISEKMDDKYHGYVVWIFEQALINYGCAKFNLTDLENITERCIKYINKGQELLSVIPKESPQGNNLQLWSVAAKLYFSEDNSLKNQTWL